MDLIQSVLNTALNCLNVRLTYGPYSFTVLSAWLAFSVLTILFVFLRKLLDW